MVPNFYEEYVSNDHCWGRYSFLKTRWNAETLLPKEVLDFLLLQQQAVAIVYWCKLDTVVRGVGVVIGGDIAEIVENLSFEKTWLTDWVSEWLTSEKVTTR